MHTKHYGIQALVFAVLAYVFWYLGTLFFIAAPELALISGVTAVGWGLYGIKRAKNHSHTLWYAAAAVVLGAIPAAVALVGMI